MGPALAEASSTSRLLKGQSVAPSRQIGPAFADASAASRLPMGQSGAFGRQMGPALAEYVPRSPRGAAAVRPMRASVTTMNFIIAWI